MIGTSTASWDDAWAFDLATAQSTDDLPYWEELVAELKPRRVLELGCGTGRVSFPLATRGIAVRPDFQLAGLDARPSYLDRARARLISTYPSLAAAVRFVEGELSSFTLDERYDLVVLASGNLGLLTGAAERTSCLLSVRRQLVDGGRLTIDVRVPELALLALAQRGALQIERREIERPRPANGVDRLISFIKTTCYDPATQTESKTQQLEIYHSVGRRQSRVRSETLHHFFPCELRLLLTSCGFAPSAEYGDYDRSPFGPSSKRYLWLMTTV